VIRLLFATLLLMTAGLAAAPVDFVREVRPVFERHCYKCHGPDAHKSGYRLDIKAVALKGGDTHAPNVVAGDSSASPLYRFVSGADPEMTMPPKKSSPHGLDPAELDTLRRWLDEGAVWPAGVDTAQLEDRMDWWAFKPLVRPELPLPSQQGLPPIDAFVQAALEARGLTPSPEADRPTLIRRLFYNLTGLPPSPEELAAFVTSKDPLAYEKLVDSLLASPRYGERWARHWLDLVHFGETHGYDKDKPRPHAWPYRDYVIRAFNEDKPYPRFVQEQIAGDVMFPGSTDGVEALGFIAAGPWDLIGHMEVPESKIDGKIARHLDRDDMVQNTIGAFMSLTVGCAQCHYHKFDPISQEDYYALQAVFAAVDRAEVKYYRDPALTQQRAQLETQKRTLEAKKGRLEKEMAAQAGPKLAELDKAIAAARKAATGNAVPQFGYHSALSTTQTQPKWVQLDLGRTVNLTEVILSPAYDDFRGIGPGFGFPLRYKVEISDDPTFKPGPTTHTIFHRTGTDIPNPGTALQRHLVKREAGTARHVRVTALKLASRHNDYIFALAELQVLDGSGKNLAAHAKVSAADSIEAAPRWGRANLVDGKAPGLTPGTVPGSLEDLSAQREALLTERCAPATRSRIEELAQSLDRVTRKLQSLPAPQIVYAGAVHHGNGAFSGTGPQGGKPREIRLLKRGDVKTPDKVIAPAAIQAFASAEFAGALDCPNPESEGERRAALARWITRPENALTWRSIVNRVWQHHFGRALVDTPNDFGRMGSKPSHPELLDWMAVTFRDDLQGSFKSLHKLIVMSRTYRQQSAPVAGPMTPAQSLDADNQFLWRQNRRKLEAEAIRDTMLLASGRLDLQMGGPSFQDFIIEKPQHSPHYQYHLHDPNDAKTHRRSIYRFIVRSQQQPFMTVLDCADPSMRVDKRNESLSPLQALAMLNNGITVALADHFAQRVSADAAPLPDQVARAFSLALSRPPNPEEHRTLVDFAARHGLANTCRVILNLNEFAFVD
jgi:mono/diheme cytochrome c family protein